MLRTFPTQIVRNIGCALRLKGISAEIDHLNRSVKAQFKYADKLGAQYVAVIGGNELANGEIYMRGFCSSGNFAPVFSIKSSSLSIPAAKPIAGTVNMTDGTQTAVKFNEIETYLNKQ